jgi:3,4-dihydroxy 2-butanone 4-phosphate synthase/GTP cyclohydrolase II
MARLPDLEVFAKQHGLKIGTIADLIAFRSHNETLIERAGERELITPQGRFHCTAYRDRSGGLHLALCHGDWTEADEVPVRVHEPFTAMDLLDIGACAHSWPLPHALKTIQESSHGVAVLLNCSHDTATLLPQLRGEAEATARTGRTGQMDLRTYGVGAQILRDLGIRRMKLLGSPRRMPSMTGYGLEVTGFIAAGT